MTNGIAAIVFGFILWLRNRTGDSVRGEVQIGTLTSLLESAGDDLKEVKRDVRDTRSDVQQFREAQIRAEGRVDGLAERVTAIETRIYGGTKNHEGI